MLSETVRGSVIAALIMTSVIAFVFVVRIFLMGGASFREGEGRHTQTAPSPPTILRGPVQ